MLQLHSRKQFQFEFTLTLYPPHQLYPYQDKFQNNYILLKCFPPSSQSTRAPPTSCNQSLSKPSTSHNQSTSTNPPLVIIHPTNHRAVITSHFQIHLEKLHILPNLHYFNQYIIKSNTRILNISSMSYVMLCMLRVSACLHLAYGTNDSSGAGATWLTVLLSVAVCLVDVVDCVMSHASLLSRSHTHTHTQPFYSPIRFCLGLPV